MVDAGEGKALFVNARRMWVDLLRQVSVNQYSSFSVRRENNFAMAIFNKGWDLDLFKRDTMMRSVSLGRKRTNEEKKKTGTKEAPKKQKIKKNSG